MHSFGTSFGGHLSGWVRCLPAQQPLPLSASCSALSGQVLPSGLAPNGPPGQAGVRAVLLLAGLEEWSLGGAELDPIPVKTRARAEMLEERGHRLDVGLQDGEAACLH